MNCLKATIQRKDGPPIVTIGHICSILYPDELYAMDDELYAEEDKLYCNKQDYYGQIYNK